MLRACGAKVDDRCGIHAMSTPQSLTAGPSVTLPRSSTNRKPSSRPPWTPVYRELLAFHDPGISLPATCPRYRTAGGGSQLMEAQSLTAGHLPALSYSRRVDRLEGFHPPVCVQRIGRGLSLPLPPSAGFGSGARNRASDLSLGGRKARLTSLSFIL